MKTPLHHLRFFLPGFLLLCLAVPCGLRADTSQPLFPNPLEIFDSSLVWQSASMQGAYRVDLYENSDDELSVTVTSRPDVNAALAEVSGSFSGYLGEYGFVESQTDHWDSGSWTFEGHDFNEVTSTVSYHPDLDSGSVNSSGNETYYGPNGTYTSWWDAAGNSGSSYDLSGGDSSESPFSGNHTLELFGVSFGYVASSESWTASASQTNGSTTTSNWSSDWSDHFESGDGAWLSISQSTEQINGSSNTYSQVEGWDPYVGTFHGVLNDAYSPDFSDLEWDDRTGPSFAPVVLWVRPSGESDLLLLHWSWGELAADGTVSDHYVQGNSELVISGSVRDFQNYDESVSVTVNGNHAGAYSSGSGFSNDSGFDIYTAEPEPEEPGDPDPEPWTDGTPFFTSATSLWVDWTEYAFVEGYHDGYGNRTDTYANSSAGMIILSGHESNPNDAELSVSYFGNIEYGHYNGDDIFITFAFSVSTSEPGDGPDPEGWTESTPFFTSATTLWVDGTEYPFVEGYNDGFGERTDTYGNAYGDQVILTGSDGNSEYAVVVVSFSGYTEYYQGGDSFSNTHHEIATTAPEGGAPVGGTTTEPFFTVSTLWVDEIEFTFTEGVYDGEGSIADYYSNAYGDTLVLSGEDWNPNSATLSLTISGTTVQGSYSGDDTFYTYSYVISTSAPEQPGPISAPDAFWVRGTFYVRQGCTSHYNGPEEDHWLSLEDLGDGMLALQGSDSFGYFSGTYGGLGGVFLLHHESEVLGPDTLTVPAIAANTNGTLHLAADVPPANLPPALRIVDQRIWQFLGVDGSLAFYGSAADADESSELMLIPTDGAGVVSYLNYSTDQVVTGSYSITSRLFQTGGPDSGFPMPVNGVDPLQCHKLWGLAQAEGGLPATFLLDGNIWRFAGTDASSGAALYHGYYNHQLLSVGLPDADGARLVTVTERVNDNNYQTTGTLNGTRGSVRLRDGRIAFSGSLEGQRLNPTLNPDNLHTIAADLDITGNVVSFGTLAGDAAVAGVVWQFVDEGGHATLHNVLGRPESSWLWSRADNATGDTTAVPAMELDALNRLRLFDPALDPAGNRRAGVVLNPANDGVSTLRGTLRVRPGGDISMGTFTAGGEP